MSLFYSANPGVDPAGYTLIHDFCLKRRAWPVESVWQYKNRDRDRDGARENNRQIRANRQKKTRHGKDKTGKHMTDGQTTTDMDRQSERHCWLWHLPMYDSNGCIACMSNRNLQLRRASLLHSCLDQYLIQAPIVWIKGLLLVWSSFFRVHRLWGGLVSESKHMWGHINVPHGDVCSAQSAGWRWLHFWRSCDTTLTKWSSRNLTCFELIRKCTGPELKKCSETPRTQSWGKKSIAQDDMRAPKHRNKRDSLFSRNTKSVAAHLSVDSMTLI